MTTFTKGTATTILDLLRSKGYTIDSGLCDAETAAVELAFKAPLPPELKILLKEGIIKSPPVSKNPKKVSRAFYPDWRDPEKEAAQAKDWIEEHVFRFDIVNNNYWFDGFGKKPRDIEAAVQQALAVIRTWPPLFPIHGHRFMPSDPQEVGNPVLSVWQAIDTVYYGMSLIEHFNVQFHLGMDVEKEDKKPVPFWGDAFDLDQVWQPMHPGE